MPTALQSHRSAVIGSTFVARRAGMIAASDAMNISNSDTDRNVSGSVALTLTSMLETNRVSASATAPPSPTPIMVSLSPRPIISRKMSRDSAPRAIRSPISPVRCDTA